MWKRGWSNRSCSTGKGGNGNGGANVNGGGKRRRKKGDGKIPKMVGACDVRGNNTTRQELPVCTVVYYSGIE